MATWEQRKALAEAIEYWRVIWRRDGYTDLYVQGYLNALIDTDISSWMIPVKDAEWSMGWADAIGDWGESR